MSLLINAEIYLLLCVSFFLLYILFFLHIRRFNYPIQRQLFFYYNSIVLFYSILIVYNNNYQTQYFTFFFEQNNMILLFKLLILFFFFLFFCVIQHYIKNYKINAFELYLLFVYCLISFLLLLSTSDVLLLYLLLELQSMCFYVLASLKKKNILSIEAGFKYFIIGSFSSSLLLFSFSLLYGITGLTNIKDFFYFFNFYFTSLDVHLIYFDAYLNVIIFSFTLLVVGFLFKLYAAPLHLWIVDVYNGVSVIVLTFFAIFPSIALYFFFFKILFIFFYISYLKYVLLFFAVASLFFGSLGALFQKKVKKLIAYSSIANTGYLLFILFFCVHVSILNVFNFLMYLIIYLISIFGLCTVLLSVYTKSFGMVTYLLQFLAQFRTVYKSNVLVSIILFVFICSIAGIPPFPGFIAKFYLFFNLFLLYSNYFFSLMFIIFTIIGTFYYLRIIKIVFFNYDTTYYFVYKISMLNALVMTCMTLFLLCLLFKPSILLNSVYLYTLI